MEIQDAFFEIVYFCIQNTKPMRTLTIVLVVILAFALQASGQADKESLYLTGKVSRKQIEGDKLFGSYHHKQYKNYTPKVNGLDFDKLPEYDIQVVLGTWCPDSQVQVPRFLKILDDLGYNKKITFIAVNTNKEVPGHSIDSLGIQRVPTFIFYRDGNEEGRIIESPEESLEKDILAIIGQKH